MLDNTALALCIAGLIGLALISADSLVGGVIGCLLVIIIIGVAEEITR